MTESGTSKQSSEYKSQLESDLSPKSPPNSKMRSPTGTNVTSPVISPSATLTSPPMRPANNQRQPSNGLRLAPMPKYHPAVYRSPATSSTNTPVSSRPSSRGLLSPRTHVRQVSDSQRQHIDYQRQMLATLRQTAGLVAMTPSEAPSKPLILPHDSPGPATPLNLADPDDYLSARSIGEGSPRELAERLVREEQERRNGMRVDRTSPAVSPRC